MERNRYTYSSARFYGKTGKYDSDVYARVESEPDELIMTDDFIKRTFNSSSCAFQNQNLQGGGSVNSRPSDEIIILNNETPNGSAQQSQQDKPEVDMNSIRLLQPRGMLNDILIEFYMNYLLEQSEFHKTKKLHIFSTYFFTKLKAKYSELGKGMEEIKRLSTTWHKNLSLMDKEYLVVPTCDSSHWLLVIICFPNNIGLQQNNVINLDGKKQSNGKTQPCLLIFDSLGYKFMTKFTRPIRLFLAYRSEYENKKKGLSHLDREALPEYTAKVPRQTNAFDCGVHLLYNFQKFISQPRDSLRKIVEGANLEYEWSIDTREQREKIKRVCLTFGRTPKN